MRRVLQAVPPVLLLTFLSSGWTIGIRSADSASKSSAFPPREAAAIYKSKCATCHGKDGRAKTIKAKFNRARDIAEAAWQDNTTDERIFNSIANGKGKKMPGFARKLSMEEIEALVRFVRGLRR